MTLNSQRAGAFDGKPVGPGKTVQISVAFTLRAAMRPTTP